MGDLLFLSPLSTLEGEVDGSEAYFSSIPCPLQKREGGWEEDYSSSVSRPLQREGGDLEDYSSPALIHSGGGGGGGWKEAYFSSPSPSPACSLWRRREGSWEEDYSSSHSLTFWREGGGWDDFSSSCPHPLQGWEVGGRKTSLPYLLWRGKVGWRRLLLLPPLSTLEGESWLEEDFSSSHPPCHKVFIYSIISRKMTMQHVVKIILSSAVLLFVWHVVKCFSYVHFFSYLYYSI